MALSVIKNAIAANKDDSLKVLIDGPVQADAIKKFLESQGFSDVVLEDDDGNLYLTAGRADENVSAPVKTFTPKPKVTPKEIPSTIGVIISCRNKDYDSAFIRKFLLSLLKAEKKPNVLALLDSAVKLSAYNSPSCVMLKKLESLGVQILISESCADRLGIVDAAGAGVVVDMSEIIDEIFSCSKIVSI